MKKENHLLFMVAARENLSPRPGRHLPGRPPVSISHPDGA